MTHYEKVTREEIARRNYTEGTTRAYLRVLDDLAGYFQQPPERLKPEQIREYTAHLFRDKKLSDNTVNQIRAARRRGRGENRVVFVLWLKSVLPCREVFNDVLTAQKSGRGQKTGVSG